MKAFFASMDLYKVIIIVCLLLMPVAGGWVYWLDGKVGEGRKAVRTATASGTGDLQRIGAMQQEIDNMLRNAGKTESERDGRVYFDRQVNRSSPDLKQDDYQISELQSKPVNNLKARDSEFEIGFKRAGRTAYPMTRELITTILFNCESQSPAWRLRRLEMRNAAVKEMRGRNKKPELEVEDSWFVDKMVFARRAPDLTSRPRRR